MLRVALMCFAVCTAFLLGDRASPGLQDKPAKISKATALHEVLRPYVGLRCSVDTSRDSWTLDLRKNSNMIKNYQVEAVGVDFVRLSRKAGNVLIPLSAIQGLWID